MSVDVGCHTWAMRPCPRPSAAWLAPDDEFVVFPWPDEFVVAPRADEFVVAPWPALPLLGHWLVALGQPMLETWNERVWCTQAEIDCAHVTRRPGGLYPGGVPWPVHFTKFLAALT
jgi:hypothetical protein